MFSYRYMHKGKNSTKGKINQNLDKGFRVFPGNAMSCICDYLGCNNRR